jgi:hypothetical protein
MKKNDVLFKEYDIGTYTYFIYEGELQIFKNQ